MASTHRGGGEGPSATPRGRHRAIEELRLLLPLEMQAAGYRSLARLTGNARWWAPQWQPREDVRRHLVHIGFDQNEITEVAAATTPDATRAMFEARPDWRPYVRTLATHMGCVTPAVALWFVRQDVDTVEALAENPNVPDTVVRSALQHLLQMFLAGPLSEQAWLVGRWLTAAGRRPGTALWDPRWEAALAAWYYPNSAQITLRLVPHWEALADLPSVPDTTLQAFWAHVSGSAGFLDWLVTQPEAVAQIVRHARAPKDLWDRVLDGFRARHSLQGIPATHPMVAVLALGATHGPPDWWARCWAHDPRLTLLASARTTARPLVGIRPDDLLPWLSCDEPEVRFAALLAVPGLSAAPPRPATCTDLSPRSPDGNAGVRFMGHGTTGIGRHPLPRGP